MRSLCSSRSPSIALLLRCLSMPVTMLTAGGNEIQGHYPVAQAYLLLAGYVSPGSIVTLSTV